MIRVFREHDGTPCRNCGFTLSEAMLLDPDGAFLGCLWDISDNEAVGILVGRGLSLDEARTQVAQRSTP